MGVTWTAVIRIMAISNMNYISTISDVSVTIIVILERISFFTSFSQKLMESIGGRGDK